ncbi:tubulin-specific chaperone C-like isoform X1 [Homarus americanus]|uniref:Tubulin-specific chaperone C-like n=1 Tax=Homarus americanus TaxID=6706 RepID=A0A8J5JK24_HOMAM|nr:tubulin-specific chaperone C-like isoform X1 [Homarus americanus]KAG7159627.1 Tubulin-specific chaperone C-like [Homarus americanus]
MDPTQSSSYSNLLERMKQRTDDLAQKAEQRRSEKESNAAVSEKFDYFHETFQQMKKDLETKIEEVGNVKKANLITYLDNLVEDSQQMQQLLNESSMFLASFQMKKASAEMKELDELIHCRIEELQPKKRFGFGKKKVTEKTENITAMKDSTDSSTAMQSNSLDEIIKKQFFGFKDQAHQTLTKSAGELENRQMNLQNLQDCKVIALGNPSTLQVASLRNCTVIIGPTSRSAFIKDCINCKFVMACQQVRIHNTQNTQFYLHVTGAAIIENCQKVQFAPYTLRYPELEDHYCQSGLDLNINQWDKIDDFHWLSESEISPNWSVIPEDERLENWLE